MKIEDFSPFLGMLTGKGAMGNLIRSGVGGAIPMAIAQNQYEVSEKKRQEKEKALAEAAAAEQAASLKAATGMKKGGKVKASSASKRADGIAQRGKTRGRMI